jgi:hypothetical protein
VLLVWFELQSDPGLWAPPVFALEVSSLIPLWWLLGWKPVTVNHKTIIMLRAVCIYMKPYGFWQWCVIFRETVLLDFVHNLSYKKIKLQCFESWTLLLSSDERRKRTGTLSVRSPGPGLWLAQPGGPTNRHFAFFLPFHLKMEAVSSLQNAVVL